MSDYFDHVSCHSCHAQLDPERIETVEGRMVCPACGNDLGLTDLFGVKAAFMEEDGPHVTLEDLVPSGGAHFDNPWAGPDLGDYAKRNARWEWKDEHQRAPQGPEEPVQAQWQSAPRRAAPADVPVGAVRARPLSPPPEEQAAPPRARARRFAGPDDAKPPEGAMVHVPSEDEFDDAPAEPASALDALRDLKGPPKKRRRRY